MIVCLWQMLGSMSQMEMENAYFFLIIPILVLMRSGPKYDKNIISGILALSSRTHGPSLSVMVPQGYRSDIWDSKEYGTIEVRWIYLVVLFTMHGPMFQMRLPLQQSILWVSEMSLSLSRSSVIPTLPILKYGKMGMILSSSGKMICMVHFFGEEFRKQS